MATQARAGRRPPTAVTEGTPLNLNGNNAVAQAMRQTAPDVVAAYPITPSTIMVESFSEFVANREVPTEFVAVESEHSAMSACIGAAAAGGRVQTVTTSQGMALMWEMLYIAAGMRLPIVLHATNRTLSGPINIHCDHSDTMGARDAGWIQLYDENPQEAYDNALMAVRIAEHPDVRLPVMHSQDGFTISHTVERVIILKDEVAKRFLGSYTPAYSLLDTRNPVTMGSLVSPEYLFEMKHEQEKAIARAAKVIVEIGQEYGRISGRYYDLIEGYRLEDADYVLVGIGSTMGTVHFVVDQLREKGVKAGLLKVRSFRPFPSQEITEALRGKEVIGVLDRALSCGAPGNPLYADLSTSLFQRGERLRVISYAYGLGGRDLLPNQIHQAYQELIAERERKELKSSIRYLGLKE